MRSLPGRATLELQRSRPTHGRRRRGAGARSSGARPASSALRGALDGRRRARCACACTSRARRRCWSRRPRRRCSRARARAPDVKLGEPTLEDVFIHLTGTGAAMSATAAATCAAARPRRRGVPAPCSGATSTSPAASCPVFLAQVILQPLFLLFVFGKVLGEPRLHPARLRRPAVPRPARADRGDHRRCRRSRFPLVIEFGWTKEIEDRLLAPMPTRAGRRREDGVRDAARAHRGR